MSVGGPSGESWSTQLLERLSTIQSSIVSQRAVREVFDQILGSLTELLGDEVAVLRVGQPGAAERAEVVASVGASQEQMEGLQAAMAAPVFSRGEIVGSLGIASQRPGRAYDLRDQRALAAFAKHVSLALNHARALEEVAHEAFHDSLTGMPNRALFLNRIALALARSERSGRPVGVLFVDLDDFKTINDSLGHRAGDDLLRQAAIRFEACLRPADTIARMGGDEFAVLLDEIRDSGDATRAAERLLESLNEAITVDGREVFVSASIGIAAGDTDAETLLRDADLAMYRAKADGGRRHRTFEPGMHAAAVERLEMEFDLKRAIERNELELAYQPIFSMTTGAVAGLEALVRWHHPQRGLVAPDRFIPLAESTGAIDELGRWVLRAACHQGALWRAKYPAMPGLQVGVNVSGAQLSGPTLVADVSEALQAAQLDPEGLTLEITETALMEDLDTAAQRLSELKGLGVQIAVDDFGVGHSSLRYLKHLPLDNLKIAQPFVDEIGRPDAVPPILRAVLELAEVFQLRPVAEGVERPEQQFTLLRLGCELGQGHLLSEPIPASEADDLILRVGLLGGPAVRPQKQGAFRRLWS